MDTFGWDVRTVRPTTDLGRLRPDPSILLCSQRGGGGGDALVLRLDDEVARAVEAIARRPGVVTAPEVCAIIETRRAPEAVLGKLIAQGVIRGSAS